MAKIPLVKPDLPALDGIEGSFREILENGRITNFGKYVAQFEKETADFIGAHTVTVSSGTLALIFTLQALGLKSGQKVVVPSFTFLATAQAILYAGGVPLFADVGEDFTISIPDLEALLRQHRDVGAVLPVHTYGLICQADQIQRIVDRASRAQGSPIPVLYDAAHAFGAERGGVRAGRFGSAEAFSLSVTKVLTTVEGGLVSSSDPGLIERIRRMRNYGMESFSYNATLPGLNGKMSEFHAIVGLENLRLLEGRLQQRAERARYYIQQIEAKTPFRVMPVPEGVRHTFKDFTVLAPKELGAGRDRIQVFLKERGVESRAYFSPPVHRQEYFSRFADRSLPMTEEVARRVITLPFFTGITKEEMDCVVGALCGACEGVRA